MTVCVYPKIICFLGPEREREEEAKEEESRMSRKIVYIIYMPLPHIYSIKASTFSTIFYCQQAYIALGSIRGQIQHGHMVKCLQEGKS